MHRKEWSILPENIAVQVKLLLSPEAALELVKLQPLKFANNGAVDRPKLTLFVRIAS